MFRTRIRMFLGILDSHPDQFVQFRLRIRILPSASKKLKKNLDFYCTVLWLLYDFLSLTNDANIPSKRNKWTKLIFVSILKVSGRKEQDLEPDPHPDLHQDLLVKGTDPRIRIRIRIRMSRIRNTTSKKWILKMADAPVFHNGSNVPPFSSHFEWSGQFL